MGGQIWACLSQSSAILVHSYGISFSMLARFAKCWGSGALLRLLVGVCWRWLLCWRLCYCYFTFFAVKTLTNLGSTSIRLLFVEAWLCFAASLRLSWGISLIILAIFTHCSQNMLWALLGMWGCCSAFHVFPNWFEAKSPLSFARLKPSDDERTEISKKISWILRHGAKKAWESPHYWNSCCNMLKPNHES